ncbi:chaplin [Streptomyces sp. SCA3-4]|uniref:chaplin n=1 Tax=Streptomyces sichuanensis TaxID=2871810 RepID=UPI001CE2CB25|nr:chaplin [Streptomyces sichuanensis]MCA6095377.1 chaplin [Streptomyces sichuanensis]
MNTAKKAALALAAAGVAVSASVVPAVASDDDFGGALASGVAKGSPGVVSGNVIQVPIDIPINICGNTIDIIALLNPTFGNTCINGDVKGREEHHEFEHHHSSHERGHHDDHGHHDGGHHHHEGGH